MSPLEDEFGGEDVEIDYEVVDTLDSAEVEELERLLYGCRMVEYKKEKVYVDVRANEGFINFSGTSVANNVSISFAFDRRTHQVIGLNGVDMEWVRTFLCKYRIVED